MFILKLIGIYFEILYIIGYATIIILIITLVAGIYHRRKNKK